MEPGQKKALITQLSSAGEEERRLAMEALKYDLSVEDLDWLTRPLSDESWRVRKESIEGLSSLSPTPQLISALVPLMDPERELTLRNSVVEVLERIGPEAAKLLVEYLDTEQADVRKFLVDILGNIAHPDTVPALLGLLSDPEDNIKAAAAEALAAIGDPSVCQELLLAMKGASEWFIYSLLVTLARLRCREALPVFFDYLGNNLLAKPALSGIGVMGGLEEGIHLVEMMRSMTRGTVRAACIACGCIFRRYAMENGVDTCMSLIQSVFGVLDDEMLRSLESQLSVADDVQDRRNILAVLGMSNSKHSLDAILNFIEDDTLALDLDLALLTMGTVDPGHITDLLDHHDPLVRQRAVRTLKALGRAESIGRLYELLRDESGHVRKDAAGAISSLGDSSSIEKLLPVLEDEYGDVAQSAAQSLVSLGQRSPEDLAARIIPMLDSAAVPLYTLLMMILTETEAPDWEGLCLRAAQNPEPEVREAAVSCLKRSTKPAAIATIINSLADENAQVRGQAVAALEELRHPEAIDPLKAAIHDQDAWVRSSAVSALSVQPAADPADFKALLEGDDFMMQTAALDALGQMAAGGDDSALGLLIEQFEAGTLEVRRNICSLLSMVENPAAFDLLSRAVEDPDPSVRIFAVHALSQRNEDQIRDLLIEAGDKDVDKQVREAVRTVLEGLK